MEILHIHDRSVLLLYFNIVRVVSIPNELEMIL